MRTKQRRTNQEARAAGKARRVRSGALGKLLIMLAIVAAVVFGVAIFFKVSTIEVQGNTVYSSEQIEQLVLNDEYSWNSLYVLLKYRIKDTGKVPFVDTMEVTLDDPHTVHVLV